MKGQTPEMTSYVERRKRRFTFGLGGKEASLARKGSQSPVRVLKELQKKKEERRGQKENCATGRGRDPFTSTVKRKGRQQNIRGEEV